MPKETETSKRLETAMRVEERLTDEMAESLLELPGFSGFDFGVLPGNQLTAITATLLSRAIERTADRMEEIRNKGKKPKFMETVQFLEKGLRACDQTFVEEHRRILKSSGAQWGDLNELLQGLDIGLKPIEPQKLTRIEIDDMFDLFALSGKGAEDYAKFTVRGEESEDTGFIDGGLPGYQDLDMTAAYYHRSEEDGMVLGIYGNRVLVENDLMSAILNKYKLKVETWLRFMQGCRDRESAYAGIYFCCTYKNWILETMVSDVMDVEYLPPDIKVKTDFIGESLLKEALDKLDNKVNPVPWWHKFIPRKFRPGNGSAAAETSEPQIQEKQQNNNNQG